MKKKTLKASEADIVKCDNWPAPPHSLSPPQREIWNQTVRSFAQDWFKESDLPLLVELCRAHATSDMLASGIETEKDISELKKLLDLRDREVRRAAALSRTLRLPPQSRYDRQAAGVKARESGSRPWIDNSFAEFA